MGSNNWSTNSTGKRKFDSFKKKKVDDNHAVWTWSVIFILALLFTLPSFFKDYLKEVLTLYLPQIGVVLITIIILTAAWDTRVRRKQRSKQKKLSKKLKLQKQALKSHFDVQKSQDQTLNLAFLSEQDKPTSQLEFLEKGAGPVEDFSQTEKESEELKRMKQFLSSYQDTHKNNGETKPFFDNFDNIQIRGKMEKPVIVDGEDVSSFSPRWKKFFKDHEGKTPIEKLNAMLQYEEE